MKDAYHALINSAAVSAVMDKFQADKKWDDFNAFSSLAEFGLTRDDVPINDYVERLIAGTNFNMMCGRTLLLRNLVALGYHEDSRVRNEIDKVFSLIRDDGSFRCLNKSKKENDSKLRNMGFYRQTTTYLLLAAELKMRRYRPATV